MKQEDYRFERGQCDFIVRIYLKKIIHRNQAETLDRDNNNKYEKKSPKNFNSRVNRVRGKIGDLEDKAANIKPDPDAPRENGKQKRTHQRSMCYGQMTGIPLMGAPEGEEREMQAEKTN